MNGSGPRRRPGRNGRWAEKAVLGVMIVIGLAALVADLLGWLDSLLADDAIPKVTLLVLCTMTLFLLLEVERFESVDEVREIIAKLDIDGLAYQQRISRYAGVVRVAAKQSETTLDSLVRRADRVAILNTWIPNLEELVPALKVALGRGASVRVLLLVPGSDVAPLRDEALRRTQPDLGRRRPPSESVARGVHRNLAVLEGLGEFASEAGSGTLEVRLYNSLPSISVYQVDDRYFVGLFLHGKLAINSPQVEVEGGDTLLGGHVQEEVHTLWEMGTAIDMTDWRRELANTSF